ncbi:hypothetical protein [Mesorhizobium sp. M0408]
MNIAGKALPNGAAAACASQSCITPFLNDHTQLSSGAIRFVTLARRE